MISLFALLSIMCGTKMFTDCWSMCSVQAALPAAIVMGTTLSRTHEKSLQKIIVSSTKSLFAPLLMIPSNVLKLKSISIIFIGLLQCLLAAVLKKPSWYNWQVVLIQKQGLLGMLPQWEQVETQFFQTIQTWPGWVHNQRVGGAPNIPLAD